MAHIHKVMRLRHGFAERLGEADHKDHPNEVMPMKAQYSVLLMAGLVACGGPTEITVENLEGTWDATAYVYTNQANTSERVDIVIVHGATLTLTVQADGTTTSTFNDGQGGSSSNSGQFSAGNGTLTLAGVSYQATLSGSQLTLSYDGAEYDFDADGSKDPATVSITLRRR